VDARIARLAVHGAGTISLFFIETWQRMVSNKAPVGPPVQPSLGQPLTEPS
jgi:hypothetical protein